MKSDIYVESDLTQRENEAYVELYNLTNLPTIQLSGTSYYLSLEIGSSLDEHKKSTASSKSCSSTKTVRRLQLLDWEALARRK